MDDTRKVQPDAFTQAMNAAIPKYSGEKVMKDPDKNPVDSNIEPRDGTEGPQGA